MARIHDITRPATRQRPGARGAAREPGAWRRSTTRVERRAPESLVESVRDLGWDIGAAGFDRLAPNVLRELDAEIAERIGEAPLAMNDYGLDPWGFESDTARRCFLISSLLYRYWFRVQTRGIENVPAGRVLLIGNHAGQIAIDATMIATACLLEGRPPRVIRGMGEYWLPRLPWVNVLMVRTGSVVGTPKNCTDLLEHGEAVIAFPEGVRGMNKAFVQRYQLQEFGLGFLRLALRTGTPIVPVATVGSEEQAPSLGDFKPLANLLGMPAFPLVLTPVPLPTRYHIEFGEPMVFEGDPDDEDHVLLGKVETVKTRLNAMLRDGLARRQGIFT